MAFAYYGAKHSLAGKYPRPRYGTIVEPFAGAAGYSTHHANSGRRVILNDADDLVVATWRRLQAMTVAELRAINAELDRSHTDDLLVKSMGGGSAWSDTRRAVTPRMRKDWPSVRQRIRSVLPWCRSWQVVHGDYRDLPDIEATWFVDPPYQPILAYTSSDGAGNGYRTQTGIDYDELAKWCESRRGQVIVCEQYPAAWLPFWPLARQISGNLNVRTELIWTSDYQQDALW